MILIKLVITDPKNAWGSAIHCPIIRCDQCGEYIETAADGRYAWEFDEQCEPLREARIYFLHAERCAWTFDRAHKRLGMDNLTRFVSYLASTLDLDEDARHEMLTKYQTTNKKRLLANRRKLYTET